MAASSAPDASALTPEWLEFVREQQALGHSPGTIQSKVTKYDTAREERAKRTLAALMDPENGLPSAITRIAAENTLDVEMFNGMAEEVANAIQRESPIVEVMNTLAMGYKKQEAKMKQFQEEADRQKKRADELEKGALTNESDRKRVRASQAYPLLQQMTDQLRAAVEPVTVANSRVAAPAAPAPPAGQTFAEAQAAMKQTFSVASLKSKVAELSTTDRKVLA